MNFPFRKKVNPTLEEILKSSPSMSMEDLEANCAKNTKASEEVKKAMDAFDKAFPEDDDVNTSCLERVISTGKAVGAKVLDLITDDKFGIGFFVGMFYVLIACGLSHDKNWERNDE